MVVLLRRTGLAIAAVWLALWLAAPAAGFWRVAVLDVAWVLLAGAVGGLCLAVAARGEPGLRRPLRLLGAACLSWGAGQTAWSVYEIGVGRPHPSPSLADVGYLAAVPLFGLAVLSWPRAPDRRSGPRALEILLAAGGASLFSFAFFVTPAIGGRSTGLTRVVGLAYPATELTLAGIVAAALVVSQWLERPRLVLVLCATVSLMLADGLHSVVAPSTGGPLALCATLVFVFVLLAAVPPGLTARVEKADFPDWAWAALATAMLAAVGASLAAEESPKLDWTEAIELGGVVVLLAAVVGRYVVVARRLQRQAGALAVANGELEGVLAASRTGLCLLRNGRPTYRNAAYLDLVGTELDDAGVADGLVTLSRADGRIVRAAIHRLNGSGTLISADDVTELEREREHRDRFMAEIVAAREDEARRVAGLLHDDAVQRLTALALRLELAERRAGSGELGNLAAEAQEITRSLRHLMTELHPAVLESQGLAAAVEVAAEGLRDRGVDVIVRAEPVRAPHEAEHVAYRVVHEALTNISKHARAARVEVVIAAREALRCTVRDDGCGFDTAALESALSRGSLGLHLVRERIERSGGRLVLDSTPGVGTSLAFELPFSVPAGGREPGRRRAGGRLSPVLGGTAR